MNLEKYLAITAIASALLMLGTSSLANNDLVASTNEDHRSDTGCDQVVRNEGEQNERTEPEGVFHGHDMPDAQRFPGADKAQQGAQGAVGDCLAGN